VLDIDLKKAYMYIALYLSNVVLEGDPGAGADLAEGRATLLNFLDNWEAMAGKIAKEHNITLAEVHDSQSNAIVIKIACTCLVASVCCLLLAELLCFS
jgi:hypothetical protein